MSTSESTIFDKKPKFFSMFVATSLLGISLITIAVYRASNELEITHEVDNLARIIPALLDSAKLESLLTSAADLPQDDSNYQIYRITNQKISPLQNTKSPAPIADIEQLEATRVNSSGGFFEKDGTSYTWVTLKAKNRNQQLLIIHRFTSSGVGALFSAYKNRMIIPTIFYLWLMVWIAFVFNQLLFNLKTQQETMKRLALYDCLTGLPNRKLLEDRFQHLVSNCVRAHTSFACCLIDLNKFKAINDRFGHSFGDDLLRQVGTRLTGVLRESDTAARLGGDEFIVLLNGVDERGWQTSVSRVFHALSQPYDIQGRSINSGVSIGVSVFAKHGTTPEALLHAADTAMYSVKAKGGGMCIHDTEEHVVTENPYFAMVQN